MSTYDFVDLNKDSGGILDSGVSEQILIAPKSWLTEIKMPVGPFATPGDKITIKEKHVFAAGKGFIVLQCVPQKNKLANKTKGDFGTNGMGTEIDFFMAGTKKDVHEALREFFNTPSLVLQEDATSTNDDRIFHQLGDNKLSAWLTVDFSTETTKDGNKGFNGKIIYDAASYFYDADIEYKP